MKFDDATDITTSGFYRRPVDERFIWPTPGPREVPLHVPNEVASVYVDASIAENAGALRSASASYRTTAEEIVKQQGCVGRTLQEKIDDLGSHGVSADLVHDLHEARTMGNDTVHSGLQFSVEEIQDVATLLFEAMEELYTTPETHRLRAQERLQRRQTK